MSFRIGFFNESSFSGDIDCLGDRDNIFYEDYEFLGSKDELIFLSF